MKRKDLFMVIGVVVVSAIFSYLVSNAFITPAKNRKETVEVVGKITTEFPQPDKKFFNENSKDPTLLIQIQNNDNTKPFQQQTP